jgi:hypothetical protein
VPSMDHENVGGVPQDESFVHHPMHATVHEAEHVREIADEGDRAVTPVILAAAVLAFIVPLAAVLMLLDFGVAHFS